MSQFRNPTGPFGRLLARSMAWGHKDFYKNTAKALDLKEEDRYLEIGFGSGLFIKKYASHVARIAGLDCSQEMVNLASDINKELINSGKAEFKKGDASSLPWGNDEFSAVVGIETFFFWDEPVKSLKEIYRVLAPGGRLVIEMAFNKDDGLDHSKHVKQMNLKVYSASEMTKMLNEAGFSEVIVIYFKGFWLPLKGHVVPKGMIVKGIKK
ncbi:MAG: class I SAM-dependent methyltransferase [Candidatus Methanofastidiosum sp.]|nr:class I SAM-dependent methyltransferase [Methanofastidiosum sp.]